MQRQLRRRRAVGAEAAAGCRLAGVGSSVPATVLTNKDLEKLVETNDDWIASRTGIRCLLLGLGLQVHCVSLVLYTCHHIVIARIIALTACTGTLQATQDSWGGGVAQ